MLPPRSLADVVVLGGVGVGLALLALGGASLAITVVAGRRERARESVEPEVRQAVLRRLGDPEPGWGEWVDGLTPPERATARDALEDYLGELRGDRRSSLVDAARALGIPRAARRDLQRGDRYERLAALSWLTLLEEPVDLSLLRERCASDRDLRAASARLLYATDHEPAAVEGPTLLLADVTEPLSVFGIDTLYRLVEHDPGPLLERLAETSGWHPSLLVQVLRVVGRAAPVGADVSLDRVVGLLEHDAPEVRAAAARALGQYGWRSDVRDAADPLGLLRDPSPVVRRAACEMLGGWGDPDAVALLRRELDTERDDRVRLAAARALHDRDAAVDGASLSPLPARTWNWVRADAAVQEGEG